MRFELRRWWFGGCVGTALAAIVGAQWILEWNRPSKSGFSGVRRAHATAPAAPLAEALEAVEALTDGDVLRMQRTQQRLIDEARRAPMDFHRVFALQFDSDETLPTQSALVLLEAFFAVAGDRHWEPVARFLDRSVQDGEKFTGGTVRGRILDRLQRRPPGAVARKLLEPSLTQLVEACRDLEVAREAAEAYLALCGSDDRDAAQERLRQLIQRRPAMEQTAFSDLYTAR
jgi:hypothetical protein